MTEKWEPAFPMYGVDDGMSLRDYFAAKAMQGFCSNPNLKPDLIISEQAYKVADAMLKARDK